MKIGGILPLSLVDYPGRPAIVVFTGGCNLRCPFCHNGDLVLGGDSVEVLETLDFLASRVGKLKAVCVTGGEPTIHGDLEGFLREIKGLGFSIKLDTNGSNPQMLEGLLAGALIDYLAIDIKSSPKGYHAATGGKLGFDVVKMAVEIARGFPVILELRTTAVPGLVELEDLREIAGALGPVDHYVLQQFRTVKTLEPSYGKITPHKREWFQEAKSILQAQAKLVTTKGV